MNDLKKNIIEELKKINYPEFNRDIISFGTTGKGNANFPRGHKNVLLGEVTGEITIKVEKIGVLKNSIFHQSGGA